MTSVFNKEYLKKLSYSFLGNLSNSLSQWVIFTFIAKKFGTEDLGDYSLVLAWVLPFYAFFSMQLRNIHVSDQGDTFGFDLVYSIRLMCSGAFFAVLLTVGCIAYPDILMLFLFIGAARTFELVSDVIHAEFHKRNQIDKFSKRLMTRALFTVVFTLFTFWFIDSFHLAIVSLPAAYLLNLIIDFIFLRREVKHFRLVTLRGPVVKRLLTTGMLTGVSLLFVYLIPSIPRFILEKFRNSYELGLFSGYMYLIVFARLFVQALIQNSLPNLSSYFSTGNLALFKKTVRRDTMMLILIGLLQFLIIPFSDILFPLVYNDDFVGNKMLLAVIFIGSLFSFISFSLNNALNAMHLFRVQFPLYGILVVASMISGYLLIPEWGLLGSGVVFASVSIFQCALLLTVFIYNIRREKIHGSY